METGPLKVIQHVRRRVQAATYGSAFYRMMLDQGAVPDRLRLTLSNPPWPGDARRGQALIAGAPHLFDEGETHLQARRRQTFEDLRDLRAFGSDLARRKAVSMIHDWIEEQEQWTEEGWSPDVLGARLANWIAYYDFYGPAASHDMTRKMIACMVRQLRHLLYVLPAPLTGVESLCAAKGLVYGGLALIDGEKAVGLALDLLGRQLRDEVLPDGGTVFRNPQLHAAMMRHLIDIRSALRAGQLDVPADLNLAIARMACALKTLRHGDGGLALFHGSGEDSPLFLDAIATFSESRARVAKRLPHMGYERLNAGRSLLIVDVGGPPPRPYDRDAHAGLASFEFSVGRERLLTNCGAMPDGGVSWRLALAATAAHNAMTIADTNACEVMGEGGIGRPPRDLTTQRYEQGGVHAIDLAHDGYRARYRIDFQRTLALADDGEWLKGRDIMRGAEDKPFALRWHVHPSVDVMLAQDGESALLRTPSGNGWRFRILNGAGRGLGLEGSVYCGSGAVRRTLQLFAIGKTTPDPCLVEWSLTREKTKKGG